MQRNEEIQRRNHERFASLSTEELKEILHQDALLPEDECLDVDTIIYISKILASREEPGVDEFTPADEAWKNFNRHYRSMDFDSKSLYDDSETAVEVSDKQKRRRPLRSVLKVACVAAALLILMYAGSLTAYAMGYDVWGAVAEWTMETFGFEQGGRVLPTDSIYEDFEEVKSVLAKQDITFDVLPRWLPDGYCYESSEFVASPIRKTILLSFVNEEKYIGLTVARQKTTIPRSYEKDENLVQIHEINGIQHYIICNVEEATIIWTVGNCECSIIGEFSVEEACDIINSIYRS